MRRLMITAGVLVVGVGGVYVWQESVATEERYALEVELDEREREIEMGRAAAADQEKLALDLSNYEREAERLRAYLPQKMGVEAFLDHVRAVAAEHGVALIAAEPRLLRRDFYDSARIKLELEGEPEATAAVIESVRRGPRIVGAEELEVSDRLTRVHLLIFASQGARAEDRFTPCALPSVRVWAPGLRGSVLALRAEVEAACTEAETLAEHVQKVNALLRLREEVRLLVEIVGELVPAHRPPATEEDLAALRQMVASVDDTDIDQKAIERILVGDAELPQEP